MEVPAATAAASPLFPRGSGSDGLEVLNFTGVGFRLRTGGKSGGKGEKCHDGKESESDSHDLSERLAVGLPHTDVFFFAYKKVVKSELLTALNF